MRSRYEGIKGKEAGKAHKMEKMLEREHVSNNAFVKKHQNMMESKAGHHPELEEKYMQFDACMTNTGEKAQSFARELTAGIDREAFPVK